MFGKTNLIDKFVLSVAWPIYPMFLTVRETILAEASKKYVIMIGSLDNAKLYLSHFIQADLGIESHLQITISAILLLLVRSQTRTIIGFEVLFEKETFFYLPTKVAIYFSITWSIYSCISSHLKGISKKREYSTTKSLGTILLFTTVSITARVMTYIMYFTPCLGLMNSLRHLQGEMYPFDSPYLSYVNVTKDKFYFGNAPPIPWSDITRWTYKSRKVAEPPLLTLYTWFTIEQYFMIFIGIMSLNIVLQILAKRCSNSEVFKSQSWIDLLVHGITCTFIPHPMEEWEEARGTVAMHKLRQGQVWIEMVVSILLNFAFNLTLLTPLIILGN